MMNRPHSGLQKQVLQLYKLLLKAAKRKDQGAENQGGTTYRYVRERFRENAESVDRSDFAKIEYLLRKGDRDLKMVDRIKSANFTRVRPHFNKPETL